MIWWSVLVAYLVGWALAVRPAMRRRMLQEICLDARFHANYGHEPCRHRNVIRGARFDRTGGDVAAAVWFALWWLPWLVIVLLTKGLRAFGRGVKRAVIVATPLTAPELQRRLQEQQREIDRLTAEIGTGGEVP